MQDDQRIWAIKDVLTDYVRSPSLRHIRDPHSLNKLAREIVRRMDRTYSIWKKWDGQRESLLKSAVACWIPIEDLRECLNSMPGPHLTTTDVAQRLKVFEDELTEYPDEDLKASCSVVYQKEVAEGTELPAIIGLLRDHIEREEERFRIEHEERRRQWLEDDRIAREQRLLSGADCNWTQLEKSRYWYCRANGRTYRLSPTEDKMWNLYRVDSISDDENGALLGKYRARGDATKAAKDMAYKPEPRW